MSNDYFTKLFRFTFDMTPSQYREQYKNKESD